ncbi:MAG TPA: alpha/beta fold hydrolase [Saprospiraceae bacterium]|nr:alpha/beta fold hydrolase [Saprospiraceae bacterium]HMP12727.1 alpha/beta fold hydrolase [Saprospiraceae bacterium]
MSFWLLYAVGVVLVLWVLGNICTTLLQDYFIFRPRRLPQDYRYRFMGHFEEIWLQAKHGGRLNVLYFNSLNLGEPKGLVLYYHGNSSNLARWGHLHQYFGEQGYDFLAYDYRGFGKSSGRRTEATLFADALQVYDYACTLCPPSRIVIVGRSMGSAFACRVAAQHPCRRLILETPFYNMPKLFYTYYPFLPPVFLFKYRFTNCRHLKQARMPVCIFQGTNDWVVPYKCAVQLKDCLKPHDEFITIPDGGHNNLQFYDVYNLKMRELLQT